MRAVDSTTDWITALGTVFAAGGTIGAVIVALRQSARATRRRLAVHCRPCVVPDYTDKALISISATNVGPRPVKVTMGYFMTANGSQVLVLPLRFSTSLPVTLQDGESVEPFFERDGLDQVAADGDTEIVYGFLTDTAGQVYRAWYPSSNHLLGRSLSASRAHAVA